MGAFCDDQNGRSITPRCESGMLDLNYHPVSSQGLDKFDEAIDAWTRALDVLPKENLTPAEQKQKDQYSSELAVAKAKFKDLGVNPKQPEGLTTIPLSEREKLPWNKALALIPELNASGTWNSSVRRIHTYPLFNVISTFYLLLYIGMGNRESVYGKLTTINHRKSTFSINPPFQLGRLGRKL